MHQSHAPTKDQHGANSGSIHVPLRLPARRVKVSAIEVSNCVETTTVVLTHTEWRICLTSQKVHAFYVSIARFSVTYQLPYK